MNNPFEALSDTKKGVAALIAAVVLGFLVGTTTIAQVGLPQRVGLTEVADVALERRVTVLETDRATASTQRSYILTLLNWQTCAIDAIGDDTDVRIICGNPPQYVFGRLRE